MSRPRVSVLMATYNRAHLLDRAIQSLLGQDLTEWELIVIDDWEDKATFEKMSDWQKRDARIRYFRIPRKGRIAIVSNFGLYKAQGEYVAILDDDDYWATPKKLSTQVEFLDRNREYVGCGGGFIVIDEKGKETLRTMKPERDEAIKRRALLANPMANATTMFRRDVALRIKGYDETMLQFADWDFWLKIGREGKLYNFQEYFVYYQMWGEGRSFMKQKECAASGLRIVQRHRRRYPFYVLALVLARLYWCYSLVPNVIKKIFNPLLSRFKKVIFSD